MKKRENVWVRHLSTRSRVRYRDSIYRLIFSRNDLHGVGEHHPDRVKRDCEEVPFEERLSRDMQDSEFNGTMLLRMWDFRQNGRGALTSTSICESCSPIR